MWNKVGLPALRNKVKMHKTLKKKNAYFDKTKYVHIFKLDPFFFFFCWAMNRQIIITPTNDEGDDIWSTYFSIGNQIVDEGFENCMMMMITFI